MNTGWALFDVTFPLQFVQVQIGSGCGSSWDLQYGDDNITFTNHVVILNNQSTCGGYNDYPFSGAGAHRYWRLKLINNPGGPWFTFFGWWYID